MNKLEIEIQTLKGKIKDLEKDLEFKDELLEMKSKNIELLFELVEELKKK